MGTAQETSDVMYLKYMRSERRGAVPIRSRPFGLRPKGRHAALRLAHVDSPHFARRALPGALLGGNAAIKVIVNRP